VKLVTYNIHYTKGKDGRFSPERIAEAVDGADVIALNEVERNWARSGMVDQPAVLAGLLPNYYWVYGPCLDMDASERDSNGNVHNRRRQFGNMLLSRHPLAFSRLHPLPTFRCLNDFNMQMGALEGVIEFSFGAVRFYSVHLSYLSRRERLVHVQKLLELHRRTDIEGGAWSGSRESEVGAVWSCGEEQPPNPFDAIVLGDFNFEPDTPEYELMSGAQSSNDDSVRYHHDFVDSWLVAGGGPDGNTFAIDPNNKRSSARRIDYGFVSAGLAERLVAVRVDRDAVGSDHQPLWIEIDLETPKKRHSQR
jgi:endonuclease/exonuclease/phosphatase family metal-dependent hydrolase